MVLNGLKEQTKSFREKMKNYNNVIIASHKKPDADSLFSVNFLEKISKFFNENLNIYPVLNVSDAPLDCSELIKKYNISYFDSANIFEDDINSIDAIIIADTQFNERLSLPNFKKQDSNEIINLYDYIINNKKKIVDIICRDHHLKNTNIKYTSSIIDSAYNSTASLLLKEFLDTNFVKEDLIQDELLCTLGYQALRVDTRKFKNMAEDDENARKIFGSGNLNSRFIYEINNPKLDDETADLFGIMHMKKARMHYADLVTFCYLGVIEPTQTDILGQVADSMFRFKSTKNIAMASAVIKQDDDDQYKLAMSIRSEEPGQKVNATKVSNLFNGNGDENKAGAQLDLGIFKYSVKHPDFEALINEEIGQTIVGSKLSNLDEDKKPNPTIYEDSKKLEEIIGAGMNERDISLDFDVLSKIRYTELRSNNKYLTLSVNLHKEPFDKADIISENQIPCILEINRQIVNRWGTKIYSDVNANLIFALINKPVQPYLFGIYCRDKKDEKNEKETRLINDLFGPIITEQYDHVDKINNKEYLLTLVKSPILKLNYTDQSSLLMKSLDYEMKVRTDKAIGSKEI
ncbi:MAG: DHH family phosphoesterase [Nanoarchaeota archaeon]